MKAYVVLKKTPLYTCKLFAASRLTIGRGYAIAVNVNSVESLAANVFDNLDGS
jgi:hypothetical protein